MGESNKTYFTLVAFLILAFAITACAQTVTEPSIKQIQKDSPLVKVSELLNNADSYKGKKVVLAGRITEVCPSDG